jgi:hypothetical protein
LENDGGHRPPLQPKQPFAEVSNDEKEGHKNGGWGNLQIRFFLCPLRSFEAIQFRNGIRSESAPAGRRKACERPFSGVLSGRKSRADATGGSDRRAVLPPANFRSPSGTFPNGMIYSIGNSGEPFVLRFRFQISAFRFPPLFKPSILRACHHQPRTLPTLERGISAGCMSQPRSTGSAAWKTW